MSLGNYILGSSVRALLTDLGASLPAVLQRARLPQGLFAGGTVELTPTEYYALWQALAEDVADELLPITIARTISAEVFDPPLFAAFCSPSLAVAVSRIAHYKRLIGPLRLTVRASGGSMTIELVWPDEPPEVYALTELLFWVALARIGTRAEVRPLRLTAPVALPPDVRDQYAQYAGVPITHGPHWSITFDDRDADRPFLTANERMWEYFEPDLRRRLADLDQGTSTAELVHAALLKLLPAGAATTVSVARELAVSTRTLQRRLQLESTAFQSILRATRESLARHYLTTSTMTTPEIAYLLGYDDTTSFYRAFNGWTGQTPETVRSGANT
ncbi:AraC family transcriptional regulator [Streptomyces sp. SID13031]|uniref:AraC family transcriptional regulator n=1 Tax=Streptomyces sp. SID13031 TaxID=2706046 RepID=UPI0013CC61B2|nr:AraC family transcriptional regulator [Streptomyces sp. SID13031]NEA32148.1 AraC family transcriptional regulator [Streptomyces sp. SID13031]